ncbi:MULTISPECIES: phasin family protein [Cyanophyceae]|uniref:phasin family protein n=1 Tax=Cyanophyceae TaxID=3028117 RepID=UPI00016DC461|nr:MULTISPECIES: hypothetical protein [Cyanophyceae]ACA99238.1 conserved hypothetical protein [Picosynechococcus sp. PCC 7002]AMA08968.1 hypothetical protein AWQ23_06375 [Picosynechococcus sp. PCC 73109]ANV87110.1 hypothetical protein AWQ22_06340 [Picosynechococcus sp. PCC 7117]ANV90262.1 hypothetical protein AWQ24_06285 [Picosynechococcus sp. PCC 8807]QCS49806.1 hypothetical protein FEK30_10350 [Picosynechococcus sp. PCC 11901]
MAGFSDLVQKAFYLGVGAASLAAEKAGATIHDLREQAQVIADEMVQKGEMNAEEAKKFVNEMVKQAQQRVPQSPETTTSSNSETKEPRRIEILDDDEPENTDAMDEAERLRREVESLQAELNNLKR